MRTIQPFKIADANTRLERIMNMMAKFQNNNVLEEWKVEIQANPIDFQGIMLEKPKMLEKNGQ